MKHYKLKDIGDLRPSPTNPREISKDAQDGLRYSLESFGDISGIVWNKRNGNLVCGHQRVRTLTSAGAVLVQSEVGPCLTLGNDSFEIRVVDWDDDKHNAAMIAANSDSITGSWDHTLTSVIDRAVESRFDMSVIAPKSYRVPDDDEEVEIRSWDSSELVMQSVFVLKAPILLQAKIREVLEREFPGVEFEEGLSYGR